jgi:hypothetical protein
LRLEDSSKVAIKFEKNDGKRVEVEVNSAALDNLIERLSAETVEAGEVKRLGDIVASIDERELFRVKSGINSS